jgi:tetratricopeptide (TPR) repeat protein
MEWIACGMDGTIRDVESVVVRTWTLQDEEMMGASLRTTRFACALLTLLLLATPSSAQEDPHAACAAPPANVPAGLLERPVPLREGVGTSHETVTTTSPQAQAYYDQGLNYLESYVWIEAARSFHQALRLDPNLVMACLGLSRTFSGFDNPEEARRWYEKARVLAARADESEKRRVEIRGLQLAAMEALGDQARLNAYRKSLDDAVAADIENPQLWLLRGNASEPNAAGRGQRGGAASIAFYEHVLEFQPDNASAHHYLVHSYETIGRIDKALEHGEAFARLSPSIPHAYHMWGHNLRRVGRVDEAIAQFKAADAHERAYYEAEKLDPSLDWHHRHNLDLLAMCYQHKGQMKLAEATMREVESLAVSDAYGAYILSVLPSFLVHRARYEEALEVARAMCEFDYPQAKAAGHALAGQALLGLARIRDAQEELASAERHLDEIPPILPGISPNRGKVEGWVTSLHGELLLRTGHMEEGRAVLEEMQAALRAVPGPDAWIQALFRLETIARSAREAGDWELAEFTARQMLDHDAAYGGSHLAMALVLEHKGDARGAEREHEEARRYWRDADPDLPELVGR